MSSSPGPNCRRRTGEGPTGESKTGGQRYANTEGVVEVEAPGGGILVLNDVWHPWWRATVDGVNAEILKANVIFRAVVCPRGRHVVRFTFNPFAGAFGELVGKVTNGH